MMYAIRKWSPLVILLLGVAGCGATTTPSSATTTHSPPTSVSSQSSPSPTSSRFITTHPNAKTVTLTLIAAYNKSNQGFNFDGGYKGNMTVTIPVGYQVTVNLENHAQLPHSAAIIAATGSSAAGPVIAGAATPNPLTGTPPGQTATFSFKTAKTGHYRIGCLFPGHLILGMYLDLNIVSQGTPSLS